ncbi:MAG TPA: hypothetical protein VGH89_08160 [Pseudonocardia sp.]|jgi:hypothetical protein
MRKTQYLAGLTGLLAASAVVFGGIAYADDGDGTGDRGANGHDGSTTSSSQCHQKFKVNMYAPMQCSEQAGNAQGGNGTNGQPGNGGTGANGQNGQSQDGVISLPGLGRS